MSLATQQRFEELCRRLGVDDGTSFLVRAFQVLEEKYAEPHRHYHNLNHIGFLLRKFDETGEKSEEIEMAIWYHDAIYDPKAGDNEAQSAGFF